MMILVLLLAKKDIGITDKKEMENSELLESNDITLKRIENVYLCACVLYLLRENGSSLLPL